jgi:hypothetical protein
MDRPPRLEKAKPIENQAPSELVKVAFDFFETAKFNKLLDDGTRLALNDIGLIVARSIESGDYFFWGTKGVALLIKANLVDEGVPSLKSKAARAAQSAIGEKEYNRLPAELRYAVLSTNFEKTWDEFKKFFSLDSGSQNISDPKMREIVEKKKQEQAVQLWDALSEYQTIPFALKIIKQLRSSFFKSGKPEPRIIKEWQDSLVIRICKQVMTITRYLKDKELLDGIITLIQRNYDHEIRKLRSIDTNTIKLEEQKRVILGLLKANEQTCSIYVTEKVMELTNP